MVKACMFLYAALLGCLIASSHAAECPVSSLPITTDMLKSPGQDPLAVIYAQGVRLYDCSTGTPSLTSGGVVAFTGNPIPANSVSWVGEGVYPGVNGNGDFVVTSVSMSEPSTSTFNLTLDYNDVLFVPAPDNALDWAVWGSFTTPSAVAEELGGISWATRIDTVGGVQPESCDAAKIDLLDGKVEVPYTATYYFYPCPLEGGSSPTGGAVGRVGRSAAWTIMAAVLAMALVV